MEGSYSQAGFYYQNNVAALKIIECLFFDSDIIEIRLENYDKGNHIDDIIVYRQGKIDYYQVKWSEDEEKSYTLYSLINSQESDDLVKKQKKSIFKQLAEGYTSAKKNSQHFSITLFTNKKASSQKRPSEGVHHNLSEIRTNIFDPLKKADVRYDALPNYQVYKSTVEKIRQECALNEDSFNELIKNLEFKFSQESIEQIQNALRFKLETLGIEVNLFDKLLNAAVKWSISGESITKNSVLKELGITDRFEDKLSHFFKVVDDEFYVPNQSFFSKLEKGLTELEGGYIFIEGLPGIGKSTAITKFKDQSSDVTLAYYCFIPDAKNDFGDLRHQSYYFLKSLCIAIEKSFPEVDFPNKYSERYEEKLSYYIERLAKLKRKIIFIIDGLDHVHRDTTVGHKSLLNHITGDLPNNIFFVLSSQYDDVLSDSVKLLVKSDERRHIKVSPFTQLEIKQYLDNKGIDAGEMLDRIERISGGIPIYLHYISEILTKTESKIYEKTLDGLPALVNGSINSYHEYLFQKIEGNTFAKWVLAILAYRKENTNIQTIQEILKLAGENRSTIEIEDVIKEYSHLLRHIDGRAYSVFHNSFREFILSKTEDLKETFNKALVSYYEQNPFADEAYRNYFSHLLEIEEYKKIISLTTIEWMKSAWSNFRSLDEIKDNLEIAIKACIAETSVTEFIRIAFLKDQFEKLKFNLSGTDINFSRLFLNVGEIGNSIRLIWDGDFVLTNKEYFCFYLGEYYKKTGSLLPHNIIKQGLSKPLLEQYIKNKIIELKADALITSNIVELFEYVDSITWQESDRTNRSFIKKNHSDQKNSQTNLKIKFAIVKYLGECNEYSKLGELLNSSKENPKLLTVVQIVLVKLLLRTEKRSAIKILKEIDFTKISDKTYFKLISFCSDFLSDQEITGLFASRSIIEPELFDEVVDKDGVNFTLRKEIIGLYDNLKPIYIFSPDSIPQISSGASYLPSPAEELYDSVFILARLWNLSRSTALAEEDVISYLEESIECLYIEHEKEFTTRAHGLFDMDTDSSFIASSIKHLFARIFGLAAKLLSHEKLEEVVNYWMGRDKSGDGFSHYSVALSIASCIYNSHHTEVSNLVYKIIMYAEEKARLEHDTHTLTINLAEVAETYGKCSYKSDFQRLYNQLMELSFGVGYRKDYQASNIIEPLELIHEIDPVNTLRRLTEVFHIQDRINAAGNRRMQHICLSYLIRFVAERYPELAFSLLEFEESNIRRDEAVGMVISPMIAASTTEDLDLYLAMIKTLPRWKNGGTSEDHFLQLSKKLLLKAIELNNTEIIGKIIEIVKFNVMVELEDEKELTKYSDILKEKGIDYQNYNLPESDAATSTAEEDYIRTKQRPSKAKFNIEEKNLPFEELINLLEDKYDKFEEHLQEKAKLQTQKTRQQSLRKEYSSAKEIFLNFYQSTISENRSVLDGNKLKILREYIILKNNIARFKTERNLNIRELQRLFDAFIAVVDNLLADNAFTSYLERKLDRPQWFEKLLAKINIEREFLSVHIISDDQISELVDQCSILSIENLIRFVERWTKRKIRSTSLLKIAYRLITIDPNRAKEVAVMASEFEFDSSLFQQNDDPEKLEFDIIETMLKIDEGFGKKFLLNSFYRHKGRYSGDLTGSIDLLFKYQAYFPEESVVTYYEANLLYNSELAQGLPYKENKYSFIEQHQEKLSLQEVIIKHLIWLFNYPSIKVREIALQSTFDLINQNPDYIRTFLKFAIEKNENEIEYSIVVLQAIALNNPEVLIPFKMELMSFLKKDHFNILETAKELLLILNQSNNSFLTGDEIASLKYINSASPLILPDNISTVPIATNFLYSTFQKSLIKEIGSNEEDKSIEKAIYSDIISQGWQDYDAAGESEVHHQYNINTNYDEIEIQSPYYAAVKASLNKIFHLKIKRNKFERNFINKIKNQFRVYDPSKLLYTAITRPEYITWIPEQLSEQDFLLFNDFDSITQTFISRENDFITLAEYGSQRVDRYKELSGTCYFEISAFLKEDDYNLAELDTSPIHELENQYAYEIPLTGTVLSASSKQIKPLIQKSMNNFRGEPDLTNANLNADTFMNLGIPSRNLSEIFTCEDDYLVRAIRWMNANNSSTETRRYKPKSEGFTLSIKKDIMAEYLKKNNLTLCYNIKLRRSTDKHRPESYMYWRKLDRNIEHSLA